MSDELARKLGYEFRDRNLLTLALTHRSFSHHNNERLEFLGDSIVNFVIGEALFTKFPQAQEGDLSRWRATLINRDTLGELARRFEMGRYMLLGQGELRSGGAERLSIISCAMEAIIGAIYLDSGFNQVKEQILNWYDSMLNAITTTKSLKDPKTKLQEILQSKRLMLPVYTVELVEGEAHQQSFTVKCAIESLQKSVTAIGTSRRRAEQAAAEAMLRLLKK